MVDNLSVIVVTYNEENNMQDCIDSIRQVTDKLFVVDSFSTDKTVEILEQNGVRYASHEYITYADKRNWSQENNPYQTEWVMHLDADERVSDQMLRWFNSAFSEVGNSFDGVMFARKPFFMGRFLKHGGMYPIYTARLFKAAKGFCERKAYDQHFVVDGPVKVTKIDIENDVTPNLTKFINTHNEFSKYEAAEIALKMSDKGDVKVNFFGNPVERRRWLKNRIFYNMPLFVRSFLYFNYRYFFQLGFLDGKEGFIFFVLQSFWFRFLVDAKVYELQKKSRKKQQTILETIITEYGEKYANIK